MNRNHRITSLGLSAVIAIAALGASSAHAGCDDPRTLAAGQPAIQLPPGEPTMAQSDIAAINIVGT